MEKKVNKIGAMPPTSFFLPITKHMSFDFPNGVLATAAADKHSIYIYIFIYLFS